MTSKTNTSVFFLALALVLSLGLASARPAYAVDKPVNIVQRPNVLVMMADDMGLGDTSAYQDFTGNSDAVQVRTPAMERLARMGIRFTDAHSPSSRCTATRAALLTGRYTWRTYLKYSVLWSPQGNPLIEPQRPTLATLLKDNGYRTGMTGKWHCGLMYRNAEGHPEEDYTKVDYRKGLADGPLNHGFDFFHGTARSHPTSRLQGWLFGDTIPAATGAQTVDKSKYVLNETGPKNYQMARKFLDAHLANEEHRKQPFFLYYACHSNHASHDPCDELDGQKVKGQSHPGGRRSDFIYENDVVLGSLLRFLETTNDPRSPGAKLIDNTLVVFTSDNGAEIAKKTATGPFRSNKASVYEGGHRVPFIAAWKRGGIGNSDDESDGQTTNYPICHVDLFATLSEITKTPLTTDGAEDSFSILPALKGESPSAASRLPIIHHDHKEGAPPRKSNHPTAAWLAIRVRNPTFEGEAFRGKWKLLVDEKLLLEGTAMPKELYELRSDQKELNNLINDERLKPLIAGLTAQLQSIHDRGGLQVAMDMRDIHPPHGIRRNALPRILIVLAVYLGLRYFGGAFGRQALYPITLLVTFLHEFGHAFGALLTGGSVNHVQINQDGSGFTETAGGSRACVLMGGYLGSTVLGNLLFYLGAKTERVADVMLYVLAALMVFTGIFWFNSFFTSTILIGFAVALVFMGVKTALGCEVLMFLGLATTIYIIQDFNVGPTSDLKRYAEIFVFIPTSVWMYAWLIVAVLLSFLNLRMVFRHDSMQRES